MHFFFVRPYVCRGRMNGERGHSRVQVFSGICRIGNRIPRKDRRGTARRFSSPILSSKIQVDGTVDLTGTTARLYRDYQRPRKWGQVQRGVPSNSIALKVAALFYPSVSQSAGSFGEKERGSMFNSSQFPPILPAPPSLSASAILAR